MSSMMEVSQSPMSLLATELLEQILENIALLDLLHVQLVCKRWAEVRRNLQIFRSFQWIVQIVARRHFTPFLSSQDWSVQRQLDREVCGSIFHIGWFYLSHGWLFFTLDGSILQTAGKYRRKLLLWLDFWSFEKIFLAKKLYFTISTYMKNFY